MWPYHYGNPCSCLSLLLIGLAWKWWIMVHSSFSQTLRCLANKLLITCDFANMVRQLVDIIFNYSSSSSSTKVLHCWNSPPFLVEFERSKKASWGKLFIEVMLFIFCIALACLGCFGRIFPCMLSSCSCLISKLMNLVIIYCIFLALAELGYVLGSSSNCLISKNLELLLVKWTCDLVLALVEPLGVIVEIRQLPYLKD